MSEWTYDPEVWARTREVTIAQDADGMWRWWRTRTGPEQRVVSSCVSGGFADPKWCYRNAVKENVGLDVTPPEGVEPLTVVEPDLDDEAEQFEPEDDVETPDAPVEPQPE